MSLLFNKSPYQLLHRRPPVYNHLCTFGFPCYATNHMPIHKLDQQAHRCVFVGYPLGLKVQRVYDPLTRKFFSSWDVIYHEHIFPFNSQMSRIFSRWCCASFISNLPWIQCTASIQYTYRHKWKYTIVSWHKFIISRWFTQLNSLPLMLSLSNHHLLFIPFID